MVESGLHGDHVVGASKAASLALHSGESALESLYGAGVQIGVSMTEEGFYPLALGARPVDPMGQAYASLLLGAAALVNVSQSLLHPVGLARGLVLQVESDAMARLAPRSTTPAPCETDMRSSSTASTCLPPGARPTHRWPRRSHGSSPARSRR